MNRAAMRTRAIAWVASVAAIAALSGIASCGGSDKGADEHDEHALQIDHPRLGWRLRRVSH